MLKELTTHTRFNEALFLFAASGCCFVFSLFRLFYTGSPVFLFLNWNLFLAFIPWFLTCISIALPRYFQSRLSILLLLVPWLLFFPNAPYILTDLFHLRGKLAMPVWFDALLIVSFAWVGLLYGFLSLLDIETLLGRFMKRRAVLATVSMLLFASAFGIYLGRYLRFNSWDIITNPLGLLGDIADRFITPYRHPRSWAMTLFMGAFLHIAYWSLALLKKRA